MSQPLRPKVRSHGPRGPSRSGVRHSRGRRGGLLLLLLCTPLGPLLGLQVAEPGDVSAPLDCAHGHAEISARVHGRIDEPAPQNADPSGVLWLCEVCGYVGSWQLGGWRWTYHSEDPYSFYSPLGYLLEEFPFADALAETTPRYAQIRTAERVERESVYFNSRAGLEELVNLMFDYFEPYDLRVELGGLGSGRVTLRAHADHLVPPAWDHLFYATVDCMRYSPKCYVILSREWAQVLGNEAARGSADPASYSGAAPARRPGPRQDRATREGVLAALRDQPPIPRVEEGRKPEDRVVHTKPRALDRLTNLPPESRTWPTGAVQLEIEVLSSGRAGEIRCVQGDEVLCRGIAKIVAGWWFEPATRNGIAVDGVTFFSVNYQRQR